MSWWPRVAVGAASIVAGSWLLWPVTRGESVDVVVFGDGAVEQARNELERRFRQEGRIPQIRIVADCDDVRASDVDHGATVVVSFARSIDCSTLRGTGLVVEQPLGGGWPVGLDSGWTRRPAAPLFRNGDVEDCLWWDTPGAGEDRPGLGRCEADGRVRVLAGDELTPAGRERFARLVVEALG